MDTEALIYNGQSCLQPSDLCRPCTVRPLSAVKLMYTDCLCDANRVSVTQ